MLAVHAIMSGVGYNRSMDRAAVTTAIERKTGIRGGIRGHRSAARKGRLIFPSGGFFFGLAPRRRRDGCKEWCRRKESNFRPRPYQGRALPLSYGGTDSGAPCHRGAIGATGLGPV